MMRLLAAVALTALLVAPAFGGMRNTDTNGNGSVRDEFTALSSPTRLTSELICLGTIMDDPRCPIIASVVESNGVSVQVEEHVRIDVRD